MNTDYDSSWSDVFAVLLQEAESKVGGREGLPEDLRRDLERLSRGDLGSRDKADELSKLCEKIGDSPEALEFLARLLNAPQPSND